MYSSIAQANEAIIERIKAARPHWVAVRPAKEAVAELSSTQIIARWSADRLGRDDRPNARSLHWRIIV